MSLWLDVSHWSLLLPQVFPGGRHCLEHHALWLEPGVWAATPSHTHRPGPVHVAQASHCALSIGGWGEVGRAQLMPTGALYSMGFGARPSWYKFWLQNFLGVWARSILTFTETQPPFLSNEEKNAFPVGVPRESELSMQNGYCSSW